MADMTLDIIKDIQLRMKDHPNLSWSAIAENAFVEAMDKEEDRISKRYNAKPEIKARRKEKRNK